MQPRVCPGPAATRETSCQALPTSREAVEVHEMGHMLISNGTQTTTSALVNTSGLETEFSPFSSITYVSPVLGFKFFP